MENEVVGTATPKISPEQLLDLADAVTKRLQAGKATQTPHVEVSNVLDEAISKDASAARQRRTRRDP